MSQRKHKKWLLIIPVFLVLILAAGAFFLVRMKRHTQREGLPVIGIAWCNTIQDYRWEVVILEEAGGNVVDCRKSKLPV